MGASSRYPIDLFFEQLIIKVLVQPELDLAFGIARFWYFCLFAREVGFEIFLRIFLFGWSATDLKMDLRPILWIISFLQQEEDNEDEDILAIKTSLR
jgi:hypothetical protein